jgi:WD40 repeat protein
VARAAPPARSRERLDRLGDPLPADALLRLGTLRHRYVQGHLVTKQLLSDGRTLLLARRTGGVFWIDLSTGRIQKSWSPPKELVVAGFSADGRFALLHDTKQSLQLWDLTARKMVRPFAVEDELTHHVTATFSPDGRTVVLDVNWGYMPGWLQVHDTATGRQRSRVGKRNMPDDSRVAGFSPDSRVLILVDGPDNEVSLHDPVTGKKARSFTTLAKRSTRFSRLAPDAKTILFSTWEKTVRSWDMATGKERSPLTGHGSSVYSFLFSSDSRTLLTAGSDPFVLVWDWPAGKLRRRLDVPTRGGVSLHRLSADGKRLSVGLDFDEAARFFDLETGKELPVPSSEAHTAQVDTVAVTPDGKVVSGANDDTLRLWDLRTGRQLRSQRAGHQVGVMSMSVSADGGLVATGDINQGRVRVFSLPDCRLIRTIDTGGRQVRKLQFCGRDRHLLIDADEIKAGGGGSRRFLPLWDVDRGRELRRLTTPAQDWELSPDGKLMAEAGQDRLRVREVLTGQDRRILLAKGRRLVFAPDGRTLACVGNRLVLWELLSGEPRWTAQRPASRDYVTCQCISADGRWLAVASGSCVELWDALLGRKVHTFRGHASGTGAVAFSPDGRRLVSSSSDTTLLVWDVAGVLARQRPHPTPDPTALLGAWNDLASSDASRAARAMSLLLDSPGECVALLRTRLKPALAADSKRIARLLTDLDSDVFAQREQASRDLEKLAEQAAEPLERFLATKPSAEARRRAERLLHTLAGPVTEPERLRQVRAVEVLERLGSADSLTVLKRLATGASSALQTREAAAGVERLQRRDRSK